MSMLINAFSSKKEKKKEKLKIDNNVIPVTDNNFVTLSEYMLDNENVRKNKDSDKEKEILSKIQNILKKNIKRGKLNKVIKRTFSLIKKKKVSELILKKEKKIPKNDDSLNSKQIVKKNEECNLQNNDKEEEGENNKKLMEKLKKKKKIPDNDQNLNKESVKGNLSCSNNNNESNTYSNPSDLEFKDDFKSANVNLQKNSNNKKKISSSNIGDLFNEKTYKMREIKKYNKFFVDDKKNLLELLKNDNKKHKSEKLRFKKEDISEKENRSNSEENSFINKKYKKFNKLKVSSMEETQQKNSSHPFNIHKSTFKKNENDNKNIIWKNKKYDNKLKKYKDKSDSSNTLKKNNNNKMEVKNIEYLQKLFYKEEKGSYVSDKENFSDGGKKFEYSSNDFSEDDTDSDDNISSKNIIDLNIFKNKLKIFNNLMESIEPSRSYNIDISHPLYNFLCKNENSYLSSNWHDRINFAFRNIWGLKDYIYDEKTEGEREKEFYNELESFHMSSKIGACGLIYSLFLKDEEHNNFINYFKKCFVKLSKENYPHIYKIYKPKFDDDLVFLFDSLVFTVILGSEENNIDYNTARKIYSNDLKGRNLLCDCIYNLKENSRFSLPIASQIDFMGLRVISEPLMPLNEEEIPIDVIKDIFKNTNINDYISEEDKSFIYGNDGMDYDYDNNDIKNDCNNEDKRTKKVSKLKKKKEEDLKKRKEKIFYERLMLEIENYDLTLYDQLKEMSIYANFNCCILPFGLSNYFESKIYKKRNSVKIFRSIIDNLFIIRGTEEILPPFLFNFKKENFITRLRYEFIKYYYKYPLYNTTLAINIKYKELEENKNNLDILKEASKESINNIENYVIPKIINLTTNFNDSYDITEAYHSHGINMCNLGKLLNKNKSPEFLSEIICREIICRTLKCIYYEHIHSFITKVLKNPKQKNDMNDYSYNNNNNNNNNNNSNSNGNGIYNNYSCNKNVNKDFICCCEKCFTYWYFFPELVPHEFIIRLINLTLNIKSADSLKFWKNILIPHCVKKFHINLIDHINIKEIEIYGLFLCIEYHFGICFKRECKKNYKVKLPLTLDDMSSFHSRKDYHLFPNVGKLKRIFKSNINQKEKEGGQNYDKKEHINNYNKSVKYENMHSKSKYNKNHSFDYLNEEKYINKKNKALDKFDIDNTVNHINNNGGKIKNLDITINSLGNLEKKLETKNVYSLLEKIKDESISSHENSQNTVTDNVKNKDNCVYQSYQKYDKCNKRYYEKTSFVLFYPKSKICFPKYSTWSYKTIEKLFSNIIIQEKFKIKTILKENIINIIDTKKNDFLNKNNICTVGSCSKIKSSIYEYNIPCHPYCILNEKMTCINYYRAKQSILLLLNININKNVFEITKNFLYLAYLHFEHGYIKKCLKVCYYIYNTIPNIGALRRDILILILQCKVKEEKIEDALIIYKLIVIFSKFYDGEYNISTVLCNILLANYYYDKANNIKNQHGNNKMKEENLNNSYHIEGFNDIEHKDNKVVTYESEEKKGEMEKETLNIIDNFHLKRKYLLKALYYSKECYKIISTSLNDIISHWIYISSLILLGNILVSLNQFQKAILFYSLSLQYSIKGKMPNFIILQNKCLLADSLKNNGNFEKAIEIAEECLNSLDNSISSSHNLTLYVIFRLAQMKQYMGCKDLIYPNIFLNKSPNAYIKKKISPSDFIIFEQKYLNETSAKYRKEAIDLYIKLYYRLKNKKNYNLVFGKDIFGNFYTKDDLSSTEDNKNGLEEDTERITVVIREIFKIKVVSLSSNKQLMLASKLLAIVLSKNSSSFVKELTLNKQGIYKDDLFNHIHKIDNINEKLEEDGTIYNTNNQVNYINEIYNNDYMYDKKNVDSMLNLQLSDFYLNKQKNFFDRSCYTKEYDLISIEKIIYDDTYFSIEDICKYCHLNCNNYNKQNLNEYNFNSLLNPHKWFDMLFYNVMKGTCDHLQILILIDLIRTFLTPLQKQLILFHAKSINNVKDNERFSEYMQYLLNNEENNILHLTNFINHKKNFFVGDNLPKEFSNIHKKDVKKNIHFLSNMTVTNPNLLTCPNEFTNLE
ncbi:conserved Plasmodium protein, unknown function [Plasmodium gallinaceum]|uniref:Clu domain-containing protein n=1 Tax=Plasmodium gallinaceum TaxID=5849 RepID=A0A1J1H2G4_PLAGA|nr:conserved Plasmodium protein, unknown function [Plasmodium gallinaceum]CRG97526.1 conserved Plasmodium protein, unknown function [Plasmodium gallinaceum]